MPSRRIPPDQRKRTEMSCDKCKARKQKCHRPLAPPPSSARAPTLSASSSSSPAAAARDDARAGLPCRYCQTHNHVCVTTRPRKRRGTYHAPGTYPAPDDADAAARAGLLEGLVKGLVPDADTATVDGLRALGRTLGIPLPEAAADGPLVAPDEDAPAEDDEDPAAADDDFDAGPDDAHDQVTDAAGPENGLPDCAGQTQYVGANSSYAMQLRVRALLTGGDDAPARFFLFAGAPAGASPAEATGGFRARPSWGRPDADDDAATPADAEALAGPAAAPLLAAYFARVHPAFPVLDAAAFRAAYAGFLARPAAAAVDPAWLCSVYCVFLLARPFARTPPLAPGLEDAWWRRVRALLPAVLLASRPAAVAALLLAAAHLNHTNRRDACWTLTGAAARVAAAVGLHRARPPYPAMPPVADDDDDATRRPDHRDALWWTLCRFEGLQAASLDRPSALEEAAAAPAPASPDRALSLLLARASRLARTRPGSESSSTSPPATARLLGDLARWHAALPPDLRRPDDAAAARSSPGGRAAVLRLHVEHQHVLCVAARGALLRRGRGRPSPAAPPEDGLAAVAVRAARDSLHLLLALAAFPDEEEAAALDPYAGWDLYFLYQAVLVLGLHIASARRVGTAPPSAPDPDVALLGRAARVAARVEADARVPGTMRRYTVVIREVDGLVQQKQHQQQTQNSHHKEGWKWPVAPCEPEGGGPAATLLPPPPSHEDMLGVMSQVSFPLPSPELAAPFGFGDGGFWMGLRDGWGDFMGFGT